MWMSIYLCDTNVRKCNNICFQIVKWNISTDNIAIANTVLWLCWIYSFLPHSACLLDLCVLRIITNFWEHFQLFGNRFGLKIRFVSLNAERAALEPIWFEIFTRIQFWMSLDQSLHRGSIVGWFSVNLVILKFLFQLCD